jgi:hypothetical protein
MCKACLPWIGEAQVADNSGRCEPGTGEIKYAGVAKALAVMDYSGAVGMEALARGNDLKLVVAEQFNCTLVVGKSIVKGSQFRCQVGLLTAASCVANVFG